MTNGDRLSQLISTTYISLCCYTIFVFVLSLISSNGQGVNLDALFRVMIKGIVPLFLWLLASRTLKKSTVGKCRILFFVNPTTVIIYWAFLLLWLIFITDALSLFIPNNLSFKIMLGNVPDWAFSSIYFANSTILLAFLYCGLYVSLLLTFILLKTRDLYTRRVWQVALFFNALVPLLQVTLVSAMYPRSAEVSKLELAKWIVQIVL